MPPAISKALPWMHVFDILKHGHVHARHKCTRCLDFCGWIKYDWRNYTICTLCNRNRHRWAPPSAALLGVVLGVLAEALAGVEGGVGLVEERLQRGEGTPTPRPWAVPLLTTLAPLEPHRRTPNRKRVLRRMREAVGLIGDPPRRSSTSFRHRIITARSPRYPRVTADFSNFGEGAECTTEASGAFG